MAEMCGQQDMYKKALKAMVYDNCVVIPTLAGPEVFDHFDSPVNIQAFEALGIKQGDPVPKGWLDE